MKWRHSGQFFFTFAALFNMGDVTIAIVSILPTFEAMDTTAAMQSRLWRWYTNMHINPLSMTRTLKTI